MRPYILQALLLLSLCSFGQAPQGINYQAIVRDAVGNIVPNQQIGIRFNIRQASATGTIVYAESQSPTTDQFGNISLVIGQGNAVVGNFVSISWGSSSYFNEVLLDISGGTNYLSMGTSQLMSVPYALYANTSGVSMSQSPAIDYITKFNGVDIRDSTLDFVRVGKDNFYLTKTNYYFSIDPNLQVAPKAGIASSIHCNSFGTYTSDIVSQSSVYVAESFSFSRRGFVFPIGCCGQTDMPNHNGEIYYVPLNATPVTLTLWEHACVFGGWQSWSGTFFQAFPNNPSVTGFNLPAQFTVSYERQ